MRWVRVMVICRCKRHMNKTNAAVFLGDVFNCSTDRDFGKTSTFTDAASACYKAYYVLNSFCSIKVLIVLQPVHREPVFPGT